MLRIIPHNRILIKYSLASLLIIILVAYMVGYTTTGKTTDSLIAAHLQKYPLMVNLLIENHPEIKQLVLNEEPGGLKERFADIFKHLSAMDTIRRVSLADAQGMVLWSDEESIIGEKYRDNKKFLQAMGGSVSHSVKQRGAPEHRSGQVGEETVDLYIPIRSGEHIIGVVGLSTLDPELYRTIGETNRLIWIMVLCAGSVLYIALFGMFFRANRSLNMAVDQLTQTQNVMIFALAYQSELRDMETGRHIERTAAYVRLIADEVRKRNRYPGYITKRYVEDIARSAPLHDIGKVGVSDLILRKPGRLNSEEFEEIKKHCVVGVDILENAQARLPFQTFLEIARQLILYHHERWDGSGYPAGLKREDIPLSARIMALADVYDALRTKRPYKEPFSHDVSIATIENESGKHFDPDIVKIFLDVNRKFLEISMQYTD